MSAISTGSAADLRLDLGKADDASCYNGSLLLGPKRSIRHLVGVSAALQANGSAEMTYLVHLDGETKGLAWATVVNLLGLPADPHRGDVVLGGMRRDRLIRRLDGIECNPAVVQGTREDLMERISEARKAWPSHLPRVEWTDPVAALSDERNAGQHKSSSGLARCASCGITGWR